MKTNTDMVNKYLEKFMVDIVENPETDPMIIAFRAGSHGAIPNDTRIIRNSFEPDGAHPPGTTGYVFGSQSTTILPQKPGMLPNCKHCYLVVFDGDNRSGDELLLTFIVDLKIDKL